MVNNKERKRALYKALINEFGKKEAYDMYGEFIVNNKNKCLICDADIYDYSEWHDTGYEIKKCLNGCFSHTTYGLKDVLETKGFSFSGTLDKNIMDSFENQLEINATLFKRNYKIFWKKKKSQRKKL